MGPAARTLGDQFVRGCRPGGRGIWVAGLCATAITEVAVAAGGGFDPRRDLVRVASAGVFHFDAYSESSFDSVVCAEQPRSERDHDMALFAHARRPAAHDFV